MTVLPLRLAALLGGAALAALAAWTVWQRADAWQAGYGAGRAVCATMERGTRDTLNRMEDAADAVPVPDPDAVLDRLRDGAFAIGDGGSQ